jgi:hypothetical protein
LPAAQNAHLGSILQVFSLASEIALMEIALIKGNSALRRGFLFGYIRALSGRGEARLAAAILDAPWRRAGAFLPPAPIQKTRLKPP